MKDTMMTGWEKKRTWVNTTVKPRGLSFGILLDDEFLQTPKKNKVLLPTRELAQKVAKEWRQQKEIIDPTKMPYTRLANSALDTVKESFDTVVADVLHYGDTDLVCYRADSPEDLVKLQNKHWDPILDWAKNQFKIEVKITNGINYKAQDPVQLRKLSREISSYNFFTLTGFYDLVTISGSLLIALAVYYSHVSLKRGFDISFLDEDWQRKKWGQDEESIKNRTNKFREFQVACRFLKCLK